MFDATFSRLLKVPLANVARRLADIGLKANHLTLVGFIFGLLAGVNIVTDWLMAGLFCLAINRACDGLDGAIARLTMATNRGAYLDIVFDFIIYSWIPLAFALRDPSNALAVAFLIFSFVCTGSTFLAFAIFAKQKNLINESLSEKSIYYLQGLTEGAETILVFILMCIFPKVVTTICIIFGSLCLITAIMRIRTAFFFLDGN